jgi:hypothetical protein
VSTCPAGSYYDNIKKTCLPNTSQAQPPIVVAPVEEKKLSTGAIVAGAIGVAALVGLVAVAVSGKKGHRGKAGKRGARGPARRRKSTHRRKKR